MDNAATTFPKPERVLKKVISSLSDGFGTPGRGNHTSSLRASGIAGDVRRQLGKFFGVFDDYRVIFTYSATDSLNMAIKGFLNHGDRVVISAMEHNSVSRPIKAMAKAGFIDLEIIPSDCKGYLDLDYLKKNIGKDTKLVIISHGSNVTGAVQAVGEIGEIVRNAGSYLLLDAAQTVGVVPIDFRDMAIDLLAFSGHKGLFGLQGTGGLIIGERVKSLRPFREGGTGFDSQSETQPVNWPEAFEAGTANLPGIISMGEGIAFITETGIDNISKIQSEHLKTLWDALSEDDKIILYGPKPDEPRISVLSFNILGWEAADAADILNLNYNIQIRSGLQCSPMAHKNIGTFPHGTLRVSPGYFNSGDDLKTFLKAINNICSTEVPFY